MAGGHCLCGDVRFNVHGDPVWIVYCHCASCRRATGSPVAAFANYPTARVTFLGTRQTYESSPGVTRSFCPRCGTPIGYETRKRPGEVDLYINAFDEPESFQPQRHVFFAERLPWLDIHDDLPRTG